jgi:hypothetical protein
MKMIKKTKNLYSIAKKWQDRILVVKDVIVEYDDEISTGIDEQIRTIENGYGGGCVWNNTYLSMDMSSEINIKDNEKYGFEENLKIMMGMDKEVVIIRDEPGVMSTSSIRYAFDRYVESGIELNLLAAELEPDHDELIENEYTEIMNLMESRRQLKKLMFSCESTDSYVYKIAKECSIMHKKLIKELLERYDRKCGINE